MQAHRQRVVDDKRELDDKIKKLREVLESPVFISLSHTDQELLEDQLDVMQVYSDILAARIAAF